MTIADTNTTDDAQYLTISRGELLALAIGSGLGGAALSGALIFALQRFAHASAAVACAIGFLALSLLLFSPLKLRQRTLGASLTFGRFLGASAVGATVVAILTLVLR